MAVGLQSQGELRTAEAHCPDLWDVADRKLLVSTEDLDMEGGGHSSGIEDSHDKARSSDEG